MAARILIVDDHEVVRQGTRAILQKARPDWEICGEAATGREAIAAVAQYNPDVVILDISMPDMTGIEATPVIAKLAPNCRVLLFTMHESDALLAEAKQLGAQGYVQKTLAGRDLVHAVDRLLAGGTFFGPDGQQSSSASETKQGNEASAGGHPHQSALGKPASRNANRSVKYSRRDYDVTGKFDACREDLTARGGTGLWCDDFGKLIFKHLAVWDYGVWFALCVVGTLENMRFSSEVTHGHASLAGC